MMVTTVRGHFAEFSGFVEGDPQQPSSTKAEVTIKAASVDSGVKMRDDHLRSPDFFDAEQFPELRYVLTSVEPKGGDTYLVTGDLTIRDVTRPIQLEATLEGIVPKDVWGNERVAVSARGKLNRKDWGLNWNLAIEAGGWLVSEEIKIEVEAALVRKLQTEEAAA
jgi:polyisoprenoid-binding protein YceI